MVSPPRSVSVEKARSAVQELRVPVSGTEARAEKVGASSAALPAEGTLSLNSKEKESAVAVVPSALVTRTRQTPEMTGGISYG
jgi:hypothetical protein